MKQNRRSFLTTAGGGVAAAFFPRRASAAPVNDFASALVSMFSTVGLQFTILTRTGQKIEYGGGMARLPHSGTPLPMLPSLKFPTASVSKAVTGAALLRVLYDNPNVTMEDSIAPHLPSHWTVHESFQKLKFRHLLQHSSGIPKAVGVDYASLKALVLGGVDTSNLGVLPDGYTYANANFALMRLLIPKLAAMPVAPIPAGTSGWLLQTLEQTQAAQFAGAYMSYTQQKVWDKLGNAPNMKCKPDSVYPGLCYDVYPFTQTKGTDFGDRTLLCASGGWNATSTQLATFIKTLHETDLILPSWLAQRMSNELMGYDKNGTTSQGFFYWEKPGDYPGMPRNPGELHARIFGFSNGVYLGLIVNSAMPNPTPVILAAFNSVTW
ncbi:MAG: serine hydrolase [Acidobacteria bacterium]|nr:serine hydrolase [Acidobacteriota bacterium]